MEPRFYDNFNSSNLENDVLKFKWEKLSENIETEKAMRSLCYDNEV